MMIVMMMMMKMTKKFLLSCYGFFFLLYLFQMFSEFSFQQIRPCDKQANYKKPGRLFREILDSAGRWDLRMKELRCAGGVDSSVMSSGKAQPQMTASGTGLIGERACLRQL